MKSPQKPRPGRKGLSLSMAPLSRDNALAAALRINPKDLARLEREEKAGRKK